MRKVAVLAAMLAVVLMMAPASQATTVLTLQDLINHTNGSDGSITVGDKVFDDFSCHVTNSGTGFTGTGCDASVTGIEPSSTEEGIRFGGFFFAAGDGNAGALMDITITYDVATTSGAAIMEDVGMAFNATTPVPNAKASVDEKVCAGDVGSLCGSPIADISVQSSILGLNTVVKLSDHANFSSLQSNVSVFKDIGLFADKNGDVSFSILDQTFSQVPEPGSIALLGSALFGCALVLRRRLKKS